VRLHHIRDLVAVVEMGSIRGAARKLGISQPAVTKSVRNLEAELHQQLLQRTPQGIVPTPAGRAFYARARIVQSELRKAQEEMASLGGQQTGSVAFGVGPLAATLIVPDAVRAFCAQFPHARVRIMEGYSATLAPLVRDETLDFALGPRFDASLDSGLALRPLFREQFLVVGRKGHPLRKERSLAQLVDADWLRVSSMLDRMFLAAGFPIPRQIVQCDSNNTMIPLLCRTDMLSLMGARMVATQYAREHLETIPVVEPPPVVSIVMFTRAHAPLTPVATAMAKAVIGAARRLARPG
jgi:DNA-binding transcriptional LysR family regulator